MLLRQPGHANAETPERLGEYKPVPKVLVTDPIADAGIEYLRKYADVDVRLGIGPDELVAAIGQYEALAVRSETKVTSAVIAAASALKVIGRAGVGVDNIDVKAATEKGIVVVNSPEGNTVAAAELTIAMLLSMARNIPQADASLRAGRWDRKRFLGTEVYGKTLGVVGLGKIGGEVARRAQAFEMDVIAYDPFATQEKADQLGITLCTLDEIYARADFITVHVPLNDRTRGLISTEQIARMKDGVRLINCARGGIIDEQALAEALKSGKVGGAAIDVFAKEPVPSGHPLIGIPNAVVTPHLGASTSEAQVNVAVDIAEQIAEVLAGRPARAAVNMPALSAEAFARVKPHLDLGEKIGSLHAQLARDLDGRGHPIEAVEVIFQGDFGDMPTAQVTRSVLAGILTPILSGPINLVNAPVLAASRGIKVTESHSPTPLEYSQMLTVRATTPIGQRTICGTVFGKTDLRIVHIDGYRVDIIPERTMLVTLHTDRPGMIGAVGTLMGDNGINIAGMNVGREKVGGRALMVLMVDDNVSDDVMAQVRAMPGMEQAMMVSL
jgi:D-3-phosphoglycerate dehydrogenase / 2-oxoglutarate reductase